MLLLIVFINFYTVLTAYAQQVMLKKVDFQYFSTQYTMFTITIKKINIFIIKNEKERNVNK